MDNTNHEPEFDPALEAELRDVAPAKLDAALLDRLAHATAEAEVDVQEPLQPSSWRFWLIPGIAVAGLALMIFVNPNLQPAQPNEPADVSANANSVSRPTAKPAEAMAEKEEEEESIELFPARRNNQVVNTINDGIVHDRDNQPFRRVRLQLIDTYTWEDPNGPTRVQFDVPREEHFLVPATIY